jgi:hypothetical protein
MTLAGYKPTYSEKSCSIAILPTTHTTWTTLVLNLVTSSIAVGMHVADRSYVN